MRSKGRLPAPEVPACAHPLPAVRHSLPFSERLNDKGMTFVLLEADSAPRTVLRRLIELCRYDFSEFDQADVGPHG